ncbi:MAG: DNA-3-methyladenine glycosylase [Phycisphaerales bacterium]|nr:DNA-3-methyladenine glycosylase [Phycisphaerales bacterium]
MSKLADRAGLVFFAVDAATLAQRLIGTRLVRLLDGERISGVIVETEAYLGVEDKAAHTYGGRRTARNEAMYGPPGTCYVYFTYGMHHCLNVVCGAVDEPVAVLIRALEPTEGLVTMRRLRTGAAKRSHPDTALCSGPGKICQALAIDRKLNGTSLIGGANLWLEERDPRPITLGNSARIGVAYAESWSDRPLRWYLSGNPNISVVPRK